MANINYSVPQQKQIKIQNALIKDIVLDLVHFKKKDLDDKTIEECIKTININYKI